MLIYSNIQAQQNANNAQRMMKREHGSIQSCPHFFFSLSFVGHHAFVENKLSTYQAIYQCVMCHIQHFNAFTPFNKSVGKRQDAPSMYYVCRHNIMPTNGHGDIPTWRHDVQSGQAKEEKASGDHRQRSGFSKRKSHSLLGRFLHAPLR